MSTQPGRRRSTPPTRDSEPPSDVPEGRLRGRSSGRGGGRDGAGPGRAPVVLWLVVVALGLVALATSAVPVGGRELGAGWLSESGAVAVAAAYTWALAARTGGRPLLFSALTVLLGVVALVVDTDVLRTGAAVLTCSAGSLLAVMLTVPARRFREATREVLIASVVGAVGAVAAVGFEPVVRLGRFEYVTLALALAAAFGVVWRLGAGLHGLGRRGLLMVLVGALLLALALTYAELLRRYGSPGVVDSVLDRVSGFRDTMGAVPRPTQALLGIPALAWGCHMRARRRQGWWVCAFGVAATLPIAHGLVNPEASVLEVGLSFGYSLLLGLVIGYVVIRLDLAFTGSRGSRARRAEEASAGRPEPPRTHALL